MPSKHTRVGSGSPTGSLSAKMKRGHVSPVEGGERKRPAIPNGEECERESVATLHATLDQLQRDQTELLDRFQSVEERFANIQGVAQTVKGMASLLQDLQARVETLEEKLAQAAEKEQETCTGRVHVQPQSKQCVHSGAEPLADASAKTSESPDAGDWQDVVRMIVRFEREVEERQNNVVLAGVPERVDDISSMLKSAIPELKDEIQSTVRLGRKPPPASSSRPRLIKVVLMSRGKTHMWQKRRDLKHGEAPIFVNHDLTVQERSRRKSALPNIEHYLLLAFAAPCLVIQSCKTGSPCIPMP